MADAVMVAAAEAIKTRIAGYSFNRPFTIERNYAHFDEALEDVTPLRIDVVPVRHSETRLETRGALEYETEHDILIRQKFGVTQNDPDQKVAVEAVDELVKFTEDIHELIAAELLNDGSAGTRWSEVRILNCPNKRHLRNNRQFTGHIRVTYLTSVPLPTP